MNIGIRADGISTSDFEHFAIEIVKKRFNNSSLHGFKEGKDDGIDGIDNIKTPTLIIQAKRWQITKRNTTAVNLLKKEIDKIAKAREKYDWECDFNYVIVTSMELSPEGLKEIRDYSDSVIPNAIPTDDYIIFSSTLTTLSQQEEYKDIFMNYGLLEKDFSIILRSERLRAIEAESKDYFSDFDPKYFVETNFLGEAYRILQREHILLIQGPAGIGKTTTCSMLGNLFINNYENNFDIIVRKVEDINDVLKLYNTDYRDDENRNLFVIFDDFLGRNKLDVGDRVLQDIKKIYSASTNSNNLFICLNSRTQILQDATTMNFEFQKLIDGKFARKRMFIIDLSKYSDIDKAHIFRKVFEQKSHNLEWQDRVELSEKYDDLIGKNWTRIIKHRNYFPRLVELIANNFKESKGNFYDYVVFFMDHPVRLYDNLFLNLEDEEKFLLFSLLQFESYPIDEEWLRNSIYALKLNPIFDFGKSLNKLDGSWLSFTRESFDDKNKVDFLNPSIIDFLNDKIKEYPQMMEKINRNSVYLHQLRKGIDRIKYNQLNESQTLFFSRILYDWDNFKDRADFIGEKLLAIIYLNEFSKYEEEFVELLKMFDGDDKFNRYLNGWSIIIKQIYHSKDIAMKRVFLTVLDDDVFLDKLINSPNLDSEEFDEMVYTINLIIEEVDLQDEGPVAYSLKNMHCYAIFRQNKIDLLQDYLDSNNTLEEEDVDFTSVSDDFDLDWEIEVKISEFKEMLTEKLTNIYQWQDIELEEFDYSSLQYNLGEYLLKRKHESFFDLDDEYDKWRDSQIEERYSLESILNKPLL